MRHLIAVCLIGLFILCSCENKRELKASIAILTPVSHPSLEQIQKGFIQTMEAANPGLYRFDVYNAQGNKTLMRSEIEEIARRNYSLVFTIGTVASQMTTECFAKKRLDAPIVFTCVNDPVAFHIVASEESSGNNVTGVKELLNFKEELAALLAYKPTLKNALLVYNPTEPGLQKDQKEIKCIFEDNRLTLLTVEVFQTNELLAKVSPFIEQADALIVLKDNTVVAGLDSLVKLCDRHQTPLMASDLDSPDKGAAFGYGVYEIDFGVEAAYKAIRILRDGVAPSAIPVTALSNFTLKVNLEAARKQGVDLSLIERREERR